MMAVKKEDLKQHKRWIQLLIAALVIVALLLIFKGRDLLSTQNLSNKRGELVKMMGVKAENPEKLASYQTVSGVLNIEHWVTDNGVRVYLVKVPTLPMVDIEVLFDAGAARNGDKGGLANLTNALLSDGTQTLTADQVAEKFDKMGAQYHATSQRDMAKVGVRSLSSAKQLFPVVETLAAIIKAPSFPEQGFKREQQNTLSAIQQQNQSPQQVAFRALYASLYAKQPYANWVLGDEASVKALTIEDLKAFHQKYYVANNAVVTMVGDVSTIDANAIAIALTKDLPLGEKASLIANVTPLSQQAIDKINFPSAQTHILLGQPLITQNDPDYYALYVGNHILGGNGSVSRAFNVVRTQHGLAYSVYSALQPMHAQGPFILACQTRNDQADKSLALLQSLVKDFVATGPTQVELDNAKQNILGGYALQFDSNAAICNEVASLGFYNLPLDHFNKFKPAVSALTLQDIKTAFEKRISPKDWSVVLVGGTGAVAAASEPPPPVAPTLEAPGGLQH